MADPDEVRRKMAEQSRKTTLLALNEKTLTRKLALAAETEKQLREERKALKCADKRQTESLKEAAKNKMEEAEVCIYVEV